MFISPAISCASGAEQDLHVAFSPAGLQSASCSLFAPSTLVTPHTFAQASSVSVSSTSYASISVCITAFFELDLDVEAEDEEVRCTGSESSINSTSRS